MCLKFGKQELCKQVANNMPITFTQMFYTADTINPIALKKAKTVCNFRLSECNGVNSLKISFQGEAVLRLEKC